MSVVCRQVEVSATGRSLVQRSPTDYGVSLYVISKISKNEEAIARDWAVSAIEIINVGGEGVFSLDQAGRT